MPDEKPDIHTIRFFALVDSFSHATMVFLGKIADPGTGKTERDLEKARIYIDFLATLQAKTKGNLIRAESDHLDNLLANLRLNYVDECEADKKRGEKTEGPAEPEKKEEAEPNGGAS
jgi:hypothetical protein